MTDIKKQKASIQNETIAYLKRIYEKTLQYSDPSDEDNLYYLMEELLRYQQKNGSWAVVGNLKQQPLNVKIELAYLPTYYATAALMFADLKIPFKDQSPQKEALLNGLQFAKERNLQGYGSTATETMLNNLQIYKRAGLYLWMEKNPQASFSQTIKSMIESIKNDLKSKKTVYDRDIDFKPYFEKEIFEYEHPNENHLWYACYGSNIREERFLKYIDRCSDQTPPKESQPFTFHHPIYFAKTTKTWDHGGKAFLDDTASGTACGRIYKITKEQFDEIKGFEGADYRKLLYFGVTDGLPVYSFTDICRNNQDRLPSVRYFSTILDGLTETYPQKDLKELANDLIAAIFPENTFLIAQTIRKNGGISNAELSKNADLSPEETVSAVRWLLQRDILVQSSPSASSGHRIDDPEACFYTVSGPCARELLDKAISLLS